MATKSLTVDSPNMTDAQMEVLISNAAYQTGYQDEIPDPSDPSKKIPNPVSKDDWVGYQAAKVINGWGLAYKIKLDTEKVREDDIAAQEAETKDSTVTVT